MFICTFQYKPEDVDCALCAEYAHHRCTAESGCPYIAERIEAGVVDYGEIVWDTFKRPVPTMLRWRLRHLIDHYTGSMWRDAAHERRFRQMQAIMGTRKKRDTPQFFAALYLLTANDDITRRAYNCFSYQGIELDYLRLHGISPKNYALAQAARTLYCGTDHFAVADLQDCEMIDTETFRLVVNAVLIARYGMGVAEIPSQREGF